MNYYPYNGEMLTIQQLSELSGIAPATLRNRLRSGYTISQAIKPTPTHDSVAEFAAASYYMDWVGMSNSYLHEIYFNWCIENGYEPLQIQGFVRQLLALHPQLKTVPTHRKDGCYRIIRLKK